MWPVRFPPRREEGTVKPRDYQADCVSRATAALRDHGTSLGVLFTGGGKTNILSWVVGELCKMPGSRALLMAHRRELIDQMAERVHQITGFDVEVEMGERRVRWDQLRKPKVVVATVQSLGSEKRRRKFRGAFDLIITDEAHHAISRSYRKATQPFLDDGAMHFGLTATPDRMDQVGLGNVFADCCFDLSMRWGIENGWLVPVRQKFVDVDGLDYSSVPVVAGDLNQRETARIVEREAVLHQMVYPAMNVANGRQMIVFCVSLQQARRVAEIFNRHQTGSAAFVSGHTDHKERDAIFRDFRSGKIRTLVNVGVATEGFDHPGIEVVALFRATRSRALMEQMIGRGTRTEHGVVDGPDSPAARRAAIAASHKPSLTVLDFLGDAGNHPLVHAADVLAGKAIPKRVADKATKATEEKNAEPDDVLEALMEAEAEDRREQAELAVKRREQIKLKAKYTLRDQNTAEKGGGRPRRVPKHWYYINASVAQKKLLAQRGFDPGSVRTMAQASKLLDGPSPGQSRRLRENGILDTGLTFDEAGKILDGIGV